MSLHKLHINDEKQQSLFLVGVWHNVGGLFDDDEVFTLIHHDRGRMTNQYNYHHPMSLWQ
jgi:hypothetical protein